MKEERIYQVIEWIERKGMNKEQSKKKGKNKQRWMNEQVRKEWK
jgi:hypothetical protein